MTSQTPDVNDVVNLQSISGWDLGMAAAVLIAAWIASIFAKKGMIALLGRLQGFSAGAAHLAARVVRYAVILVGVGIAFGFLGASVQPLLAVALVVAAVVFLALRGISANFAAGVVLQTRHPVNVGDEIEVDPYVGTVKELNGRSVVITTRDGRTVHVPNSQLLDHPLVNHSALGHRRSEISIRCHATLADLDTVTETVTAAIGAVDGVHRDPAVGVLVIAVEPERLSLVVRFWHDPLGGPAVTSEVVRAAAGALADTNRPAVVTSESAVPALIPPPVL